MFGRLISLVFLALVTFKQKRTYYHILTLAIAMSLFVGSQTALAVQSQRVGFIPGAGADASYEDRAFQLANIKVERIGPADYTLNRLLDFDVIGVGVLAYDSNPDLKANFEVVKEYVLRGGYLVTLDFQQDATWNKNYLPHPITLQDPDLEDSVGVVLADHDIFKLPNEITIENFGSGIWGSGDFMADGPAPVSSPWIPLVSDKVNGWPMVAGAPAGKGYVVFCSLQILQAAGKLGNPEVIEVLQNFLFWRGLQIPKGLAANPIPSEGFDDVARDTVLRWTPGAYAATHDVYLGTSFDDVNSASKASSLLVSPGQDANSYAPAAPLAFGQTYYWRIDEVNAPDRPGLYGGDVWSFTVEPYGYPVKPVKATASGSMAPTMGPEKTIDGSGLDALDQHSTSAMQMWMSKKNQSPIWIQYEFDAVYTLHQMSVWNSNQEIESVTGFGAKDVTIRTSTDGATWTDLSGVPQFAQASGESTYVHNTTVDFGGVQAKYVKLNIATNWADGTKQAGLAEVRFFYVPMKAFNATPASGTTGLMPDATLDWRPGRQAARHDVFLSEGPQAVTQGTALVKSGTSHGLALKSLGLDYGRTYTWKVNEVNDAAATKTWEGDLWSFSTAAYAVVDDFEAYDDTCKRIFFTWVDGFGHSGSPTCGVAASSGNATGSTVGNVAAPFAERTIVHGGRQAMPFSYDNTAGKSRSEVTRTFDVAQDWTLGGAKTLAMYFYGDPANSAQELYVKVNDSKIVYTGNVADVSRRRWNPWNVDLTGIAAATLRGVKTLTIGISGGTGKLLIDDIRLYRLAPEIAKVNPWTAGLVACYAMSNNLQDSSGNGNNGALVGAPTYVAGQAGLGTAVKLSGTADCVNLGKKSVFDFAGGFSISLWAHISDFSTTSWGHVMIGNRGEDNVGWQVRRYGSSATMAFTTRGVGTDDMTSKASMPLNEWIHIACVYDNAGNTKRIYLNGVEDSVANTNAGAKVAATTHNTYIGARANNDNTGQEGFFNGMLDEIRVYNRALSGAEVEFLSAP